MSEIESLNERIKLLEGDIERTREAMKPLEQQLLQLVARRNNFSELRDVAELKAVLDLNDQDSLIKFYLDNYQKSGVCKDADDYLREMGLFTSGVFRETSQVQLMIGMDKDESNVEQVFKSLTLVIPHVKPVPDRYGNKTKQIRVLDLDCNYFYSYSLHFDGTNWILYRDGQSLIKTTCLREALKAICLYCPYD